MPHRRGIAYSINTCKRHNPSNVGGFERVHRMLAFYDKELERRSTTSRPLSKSVADVSAFLSNLPKYAYEVEKKLVQEYKRASLLAKHVIGTFAIVQSVQLRLQQVEEYSINNE